MSAQLVIKFKRADPSRAELTMKRASQRATSILSSPIEEERNEEELGPDLSNSLVPPKPTPPDYLPGAVYPPMN
jgi:hypothetical protein